MAVALLYGLQDDWTSLRANPVFRRTLAPGAIRGIVRSPLARSVVLTALMLAVYEYGFRAMLHPAGALVLIVAFWFLIQAVQRYFCWLELVLLARSGTLEDYRNSGLSNADVAMGVIYPARIAETVSVALILLWWIYIMDDNSWRLLFFVLLALRVRSLFDPPFLLLADVESYLRKRNALSLYVIGFAVIVPLTIFFTIFLLMMFGLLWLATRLGIAIGGNMILFYVAVLFGSSMLARFPTNMWEKWRLKRVLARYESFDHMFEGFLEGEEKGQA